MIEPNESFRTETSVGFISVRKLLTILLCYAKRRNK